MANSAVVSGTTEPPYEPPIVETVLTAQQLLAEVEYGAPLSCPTVSGLIVCAD